MRYFCLICDYDGTIAHDSIVSPSTVEALKRVRASGRKVVLATGRELDDLISVFPEIDIFDRIVGENGGLLYEPARQQKRLLTSAPSKEFVRELRLRGVTPVSAGETIVATWRPHETEVLEVIEKLGLDLQITFNKNSVMVLPSGVNKATGVRAALEDLGLSPHNTVGVGDAQNDHAFLDICECSVAVQNALPALKEHADFVTNGPHGAGVEELIEKLLADDLASLEERLKRHQVRLGTAASGEEFCLSPYGSRLVAAGPSGSGKLTFVSLLIERLVEKQYQICVIDPEGDYDGLETFVTLGRQDHKPDISEIIDVLETHSRSLTVNLLGFDLADKPTFFQKVLSRIQELRSKTGRPQWIFVDEAHHVLPASLDSASLVIPKELASMALVTVQPDHLSKAVLTSINGLVLVGSEPQKVVAQFNESAAAGLDAALPQLEQLETGEVVIWLFGTGHNPERVKLDKTKMQRRRHRQKYAAGELGEDKSFYFRGPQNKLNLRAQNLTIFAQLAEGIDDVTWNYHLRCHDYSRWVRLSVKDSTLGDEISAVEDDKALSSKDSRRKILEAIRKHYTAPA